MKRLILAAFFVILALTVSNIAGRVQGRRIGRDEGYAKGFEEGWNAGYVAPHPADTTATVDTSHYEEPEPVAAHPVRPKDEGREKMLLGTITELQARLDSLAAAKPDTAFVEISVPMEAKVYEDSTYRAQVSGFRPSLDWIETFNTHTTITQYVEVPAPPKKGVKVGLGLSAGPAFIWTPDGWKAGAGIAGGISVTF